MRASHVGHGRARRRCRTSACTSASTTSGPATRRCRRLQQLPTDFLKIDGALVANLTADGEVHPAGCDMVAALVQVGTTLGLSVIAEGIQTEIETRLLVECGCQYGQGELLANRPRIGLERRATGHDHDPGATSCPRDPSRPDRDRGRGPCSIEPRGRPRRPDRCGRDPARPNAFGLRSAEIVGRYASDLFVADDVLSARALLHRAAAAIDCDHRVVAPDAPRSTARSSSCGFRRTSTDGAIHVRIRECDATERNVFDAALGRAGPIRSPHRASESAAAAASAHGAALARGPQTLVLVDVDRFRHIVDGTREPRRRPDPRRDRRPIGRRDRHRRDRRYLARAIRRARARPTSSRRARHADRRRSVPRSRAARIAGDDDRASVRASGSRRPTATPSRLFADAEVALAQAKSLGPGHDAIFDPDVPPTCRACQIELQSELARAVPTTSCGSTSNRSSSSRTTRRRVRGARALAAPERAACSRRATSSASPRRSGAGAAIDDWVLTEACRQGSEWARAGQPDDDLRQRRPRTVRGRRLRRPRRATRSTRRGLDPSLLVIEITEWSMLVDVDAARAHARPP